NKAWRTDRSGKMSEEFPILHARERTDPRQLFFGPANGGAESDLSKWYSGTLGSGVVGIGTDDPASGLSYFLIGITNATPGATHHADFRSQTFSIGSAQQPLSFSFDYKVPGRVNA